MEAKILNFKGINGSFKHVVWAMDNGDLNPAIKSYNQNGSTIYQPLHVAGTNRVDLFRVRPTQPFTQLE